MQWISMISLGLKKRSIQSVNNLRLNRSSLKTPPMMISRSIIRRSWSNCKNHKRKLTSVSRLSKQETKRPRRQWFLLKTNWLSNLLKSKETWRNPKKQKQNSFLAIQIINNISTNPQLLNWSKKTKHSQKYQNKLKTSSAKLNKCWCSEKMLGLYNLKTICTRFNSPKKTFLRHSCRQYLCSLVQTVEQFKSKCKGLGLTGRSNHAWDRLPQRTTILFDLTSKSGCLSNSSLTIQPKSRYFGAKRRKQRSKSNEGVRRLPES